MTHYHCPECRQKISHKVESCIHCGFSSEQADRAIFKQQLEKQRLENERINRQSAKIHLVWLVIFATVLAIASVWVN